MEKTQREGGVDEMFVQRDSICGARGKTAENPALRNTEGDQRKILRGGRKIWTESGVGDDLS